MWVRSVSLRCIFLTRLRPQAGLRRGTAGLPFPAVIAVASRQPYYTTFRFP